MCNWIRPYWIVLCVCFSASSLLADQITMNNGDRLSGAIIKSDAKNLVLKSAYAGTLTVPWDSVEQISSNEPLDVTSTNGQVLEGTVSTNSGNLEVETARGKVTLARSAVQSIRSPEEQKAYLAERQRLEQHHRFENWSGAVDTGLALARGNSETTTLNLGMKAFRTGPRDKLGLYATSLYARNRVTSGCPTASGQSPPPSCDLTTASALRGGAHYDHNISERVFGFGQIDLEHDRFQQLDLRTVLAAGLGYHLIKNATTTLDAQAGGSFDRDKFSTGLNRSSGEVLFGEQFARKLTKSTSVTEALQFFPNLSETGEYRFTFDGGIVTQLGKRLSWQVTLSDRYLSNPLSGVKKNDALVTTGLHWVFGKNPT